MPTIFNNVIESDGFLYISQVYKHNPLSTLTHPEKCANCLGPLSLSYKNSDFWFGNLLVQNLKLQPVFRIENHKQIEKSIQRSTNTPSLFLWFPVIGKPVPQNNSTFLKLQPVFWIGNQKKKIEQSIQHSTYTPFLILWFPVMGKPVPQNNTTE